MDVNFNDVLNSNFLLVLQAIGSIIVVLWFIDSLREYQLKKKTGFDFHSIQKRNALIFLTMFIVLTIFLLGDYYFETNLRPGFVFALKIICILTCFAWLIWRIARLTYNKKLN